MQKRAGIKVDIRALAIDGKAVRIDFPGRQPPDLRAQLPCHYGRGHRAPDPGERT